ncbi:MAG: DNA polymerase III subunit gamma/tau [Rickettsiales bacterium]|jgi:DNA polymerase-3 subunit gamma/tau|nr:DNA polymerase III subunit gamma/tau [Rickettsiales bacterium]
MEKSSGYTVLARKYRPQTFGEIIGQWSLVRTLSNAMLRDRVQHAFILSGIRGVGKTTTARIMAKSLNCSQRGSGTAANPEPCLDCAHCRAIALGNDQDVVEFDAASHTGVGDVRDIIDNLGYAPISSRYKIYIIDEVHMLSNSAFNALLKTLEEPPEYVKFIFATTEIRKVPATVLSRCIRFDLNRVSQEILANNLTNVANREGYLLDSAAASLLAYSADGSVRDSLSLLDRVISFNNFEKEIGEEVVSKILGFSNRENIYDLYLLLLKTDIDASLEKFGEIYLSLVDIENFLNDLLEITHELLMKKNNIEIKNLSSFQREWLEKNVGFASVSGLLRIWQFIIKALQEVGFINNYRNFLEILLIKICYGINIPEIDSIVKKLQNNNVDLEYSADKLTNKILSTFSGSKII